MGGLSGSSFQNSTASGARGGNINVGDVFFGDFPKEKDFLNDENMVLLGLLAVVAFIVLKG